MVFFANPSKFLIKLKQKVFSPTTLSYFLGTILLAASILFFSYHLAYAKKIIPGVQMVGIDLGNKTEYEAVGLLESRLIELESAHLAFVFEGEQFSKSLLEWGVNLEATNSARAAYLVGREGNIWKTTHDKLQAWFKKTKVPPIIQINQEQFAIAFSEVATKINIPAKDAQFEIEGDGLKITKEMDGREVNEGWFRKKLTDTAENLNFAVRVIAIEPILPRVTTANLERVRGQTEQIVFSSPQFVYGSRSWTLAPEEILALLDFQKPIKEKRALRHSELGSESHGNNGTTRQTPKHQAKAGWPLAKVQGDKHIQRNQGSEKAVISESDTPVEITLCETELNSFTAKLASEIDRPARGGTFNLESGRVIEFELPRAGYKLKTEAAQELIAGVLLSSEKNEAELPVAIIQVESDTNKYGIKELLGEGISNFKGSIAGRVHNVDLASSRLDGILIAPGETFSFNQNLGDVSSATGYKTSYIIKQGRTLLGVGGGVCQVSTTLFRAALYSGLPILERTAHAYRVHYYEHPIGPGLDATVYAPSPDLVFENDTPAHILIKRYFDAKTNTLKFTLYGTHDGRKTDVIGPVIHSQTAPPNPAYIDDPSLPKGTTKQVDWAAWGAKVTVKRKVVRNGELIQNDSFYSNYQPWQAVFLVGTGS